MDFFPHSLNIQICKVTYFVYHSKLVNIILNCKIIMDITNHSKIFSVQKAKPVMSFLPFLEAGGSEKLHIFVLHNHTSSTTPISLWFNDRLLILSHYMFFNRPAEAEALLGEPNERRRNLQQQHSLSGITDQPDLTASIRWVIYWISEWVT